MSKITSVHLTDELAAQIDTLAATLDRPKAWVIEQAIARYVEQETWQVHTIAQALDEYLAEAATGHVQGDDHRELMDQLEAQIRAKPPRQ